jgi:hypothetical protein
VVLEALSAASGLRVSSCSSGRYLRERVEGGCVLVQLVSSQWLAVVQALEISAASQQPRRPMVDGHV